MMVRPWWDMTTEPLSGTEEGVKPLVFYRSAPSLYRVPVVLKPELRFPVRPQPDTSIRPGLPHTCGQEHRCGSASALHDYRP